MGKKTGLCCEGMQSLVDNMGQAGLSAVLGDMGGLTFFRYQSRACSAKDAKRLSKSTIKPNISIRICDESGMQYCPVCGMNLDVWIRKNDEIAKKLIKRSRKYIIGFNEYG